MTTIPEFNSKTKKNLSVVIHVYTYVTSQEKSPLVWMCFKDYHV